MSEKKLIRREIVTEKPKKQLIRRNPNINPITYQEWKDLILTGLKNKTVCVYLPDVLFNYANLHKLQIPDRIVNRLVTKGYLRKEVNAKTTYLRVSND